MRNLWIRGITMRMKNGRSKLRRSTLTLCAVGALRKRANIFLYILISLAAAIVVRCSPPECVPYMSCWDFSLLENVYQGLLSVVLGLINSVLTLFDVLLRPFFGQSPFNKVPHGMRILVAYAAALCFFLTRRKGKGESNAALWVAAQYLYFFIGITMLAQAGQSSEGCWGP